MFSLGSVFFSSFLSGTTGLACVLITLESAFFVAGTGFLEISFVLEDSFLLVISFFSIDLKKEGGIMKLTFFFLPF